MPRKRIQTIFDIYIIFIVYNIYTIFCILHIFEFCIFCIFRIFFEMRSKQESFFLLNKKIIHHCTQQTVFNVCEQYTESTRYHLNFAIFFLIKFGFNTDLFGLIVSKLPHSHNVTILSFSDPEKQFFACFFSSGLYLVWGAKKFLRIRLQLEFASVRFIRSTLHWLKCLNGFGSGKYSLNPRLVRSKFSGFRSSLKKYDKLR